MRQLIYTSLLQIITLREKQIFQLDEWIFFRLVSKYSYIFIFAKTGLREIKNHWFRAKMFQKYILKEILGKFTSTARKYSQLHKLRPPFVRLPFFLQPVWERSKVTVEQQNIYKKIFSNGNFTYVFTLHKKYFQPHQWSFFLSTSKYSDFFVFAKASLRESQIKGHRLKTNRF